MGGRLLGSRTGNVPLVFVAALLHHSIIALAVAPASGLAFTRGLRAPSGPRNAVQAPTLALPPGANLCPGSGLGAACDVSGVAPERRGQPAVPDGLTPCPGDPANAALSTPAACDDPTLTPRTSPAGQSQEADRPPPAMP